MCLFYLYANAKIEIHICSNKHETGLVSLQLVLLRAKKGIGYPNFINELTTELVSSQTLAHLQLRGCLNY